MKHTSELFAKDGNNEKMDCSVRAVTVAGCLDYKVVHEVFKKHGRKDRHRTASHISYNVIKELFPDSQERLPEKRYTVGKFVKQYPSGHYVIRVSSHMFAICDGIIHDWQPGIKRIIKAFWRLA